MSGCRFNGEILAELDITPFGAQRTWSSLGNAFSSISQSLGERTREYCYLNSGANWHLVGNLSYKAVLRGEYLSGDPVIGFIFSPSVFYGTGEARVTNLRISDETATVIWTVSMTRISDEGGAAGQPDAVILELKSVGSPSVSINS